MIKTIVAHTSEVDDVQSAVKEILDQLSLKEQMRANTVGIIACHYEFVFSGVVKAVCDALPFDVVGTITSAEAVQGEVGIFMLTLMVLTSDETQFRTALTPSLLEDSEQGIRDTYLTTSGDIEGKPSLIFAFAPYIVQNSGDTYVHVFTEVSGGVPCFGTLAVDDSQDFRDCYMIHNGEHYRDRMAMLLVYNDFVPKFYIATISEGRIMFDKPALITESQGHILKEVNGRPLVEYFDSLGLTQASETSYAMTSLPFMLDYGDGTPLVSKVFIALTDEKYGICAGAMPEGCTLYLGVFDKDDVLLTTRQTVQAALSDIEGASGILIYSCISRIMSLAGDSTAEMELVRSKVGDKLPVMMAYSGGEMCPTQQSGAGAINRFHNNAFILCVF